MANSYIAVQGERLDSIVSKVLGSLNAFEDILKNNPQLQDKIFLDHGDIVNFKIAVKKDFSIKTENSSIKEDSVLGSVSEESIQIDFIQPLTINDEEENLKALW